MKAATFVPNGQRFLTASADGRAYLWKTPQPTLLPAQQILQEVQIGTGMVLDASGAVTELTEPAWRALHGQRRH